MGKIFGTNGVRGVINESFTVDMVLDISRAVGTILGPGKIAIARDSRMGGEMFMSAAISGLLSTGCSVIDIGPAPTPTLQFNTPILDCVGGVVITASHNPPEFNGIKVMGASGIEVTREVESQIEDIYFSKKFKVATWESIGSVSKDDLALRRYIDAIKSHVNIKSLKKRNLTVVVDGATSVGSLVTPILMRELGCKVISINSQMDGMFPGRNPEPIPENIKDLSQAVVSVGADLGLAHDGDADRTTFVDETGRILWGDQSFAILARFVLGQKPGSTLVTPVSSGRLIEDIVANAGAKIDWTEVGSVVVSHRVVEINAEFGGEENGGVFYPDHQAVRDGAMTAAQIVDIMTLEDQKLSELVSSLPQYFNAKTKVHVPAEKKTALLQSLLELTKDEETITLDGVKIIYDEGWILMRPSGTEPLWRCFAEAKTQEGADTLRDKGIALIEAAVD
ncbi:MAG: phosphoglucosamine mutase, partial [Candidatus Thorarchaeota archaeon]|nr:phosphoglucosamine mutase [Candidatus Thorarchaeota archaeon]